MIIINFNTAIRYTVVYTVKTVYTAKVTTSLSDTNGLDHPDRLLVLAFRWDRTGASQAMDQTSESVGCRRSLIG